MIHKTFAQTCIFSIQALLCSSVVWVAPALAQDAQRGAMLYVRLANDVASCASCHGPDPSQGRNNILIAADSPIRLVKALNNISAMGYLSSQLSEADTGDISAFLGRVAQTTLDTSPLRVWPWTLDFGSIQPGLEAAKQFVHIRNPSAVMPLNVAAISVNSPDLAVVSNCPAELAPAASCQVELSMRPTASGLRRASLSISAGGRLSALGVVGYGATAPVSRLVWTQPDTVSLSAIQGNTARTTLTLSNPGPMPAVLGLTNFSGDQASQFSVESGCSLGTVLQAGTSCAITVSYVAGSLPRSDAILQLRSDQTNPSAVRLQGSATPRETAEPLPAPLPPSGNSGGGCASTHDASRSRDVTLIAALLAAAWALRRKRHPKVAV